MDGEHDGRIGFDHCFDGRLDLLVGGSEAPLEAKRLSRGLGIGDDRVSVVVQERVGPVDEHVQVFVGGPGVLEGREVFVGRIALKDEHEIGSCRVCLVERTGGL